MRETWGGTQGGSETQGNLGNKTEPLRPPISFALQLQPAQKPRTVAGGVPFWQPSTKRRLRHPCPATSTKRRLRHPCSSTKRRLRHPCSKLRKPLRPRPKETILNIRRRRLLSLSARRFILSPSAHPTPTSPWQCKLAGVFCTTLYIKSPFVQIMLSRLLSQLLHFFQHP